MLKLDLGERRVERLDEWEESIEWRQLEKYVRVLEILDHFSLSFRNMDKRRNGRYVYHGTRVLYVFICVAKRSDLTQVHQFSQERNEAVAFF